MVNPRDQYQPSMIMAARQVLLELAYLLEEERDKIVFVGGTACTLLFPQDIDPHEGTIDIDMALDPAVLVEYDNETLEEKFTCANFQRDALKAGEENRPIRKYRWFRSVSIEDEANTVEVAVDLLAGEYDDSQQYATAREVQGLHASVLRGLDLAFLDPRLVPLSGLLHDGTSYQTQVRVCSPASLLAMKGIAITDRKQGQDKDACDIDYILRRYEGGTDALARVFQKALYWQNELVQEGLLGIAQTFASPQSLGPAAIATEYRYPDPEERAIKQQGAFQRVQRLLKSLNLNAGNSSI